MSANLPTRIERARLNNMARRFTRAVTAERRADLDSLLDEGVRFYQACQMSGMPEAFVTDAARALHDQLSILMAAINRDLDEVGEPPAPPLEMCELDDLILGGGQMMATTTQHRIVADRHGCTNGMDWESTYLITFSYLPGAPDSHDEPGYGPEIDLLSIDDDCSEHGAFADLAREQLIAWAADWLDEHLDECVAIAKADNARDADEAADMRREERR